MIQKLATKALIAMPGYSRLFRRAATYYFRVAVPAEIRTAIGKREILKSLRTSDFQKAKRDVAYESAAADALFARARAKLNSSSVARRELPPLSDTDIHRLVVQWFIGKENQSAEWWEQTGRLLDQSQASSVIDTLRDDEAALTGNFPGQCDDGSIQVKMFFAEQGLELPKDSRAYNKLCELFRLGILENVRRSQMRIQRDTVTPNEPFFQNLFAHSTPPASMVADGRMTLGDLLDRFMAFVKAKRSETTYMTYQTPVRVLREILGERTLLSAINRASIERLCATLRRMPQNAVQRYPGLSVEETIEKAEETGDTRKLSATSLENYFINITAVFNFAVGEKFMRDNPLSYRSLREEFRAKHKSKKTLFKPEELSAIFHAPLYTGCVNDEEKFAKPGPNVAKRGRFWVPLLALFQGLRCNEACQLYSEDVSEVEKIPCLFVRTDLDDEEAADKRLKNAASKRRVPIHPELIRMGFLDFVAQRKCDKSSPRLFPELPAGSTGRYSNPFSKWFSGFLASALGAKSKATFHSFRHHFRDALRAAKVGDENVEMLGGWAGEGKQQREYGDGPTLALLLEDLSKIAYPDLDLSHLHK
jgi:integrase